MVRNQEFLEWSYGRAFLKADIDLILKIFNLDPKTSWETLKPYLDSAEKYYAGIPESTWLEWVFNSVPVRSVEGTSRETITTLAKIGERKVKEILKIISEKYDVEGKDELRYKLHKEKAIELIRQGYIEYSSEDHPHLLIKEELSRDDFYKLIYLKIFKFKADKRWSKKYFEENLFNGLSIDEIWKIYYLRDKTLS